MQERYAYYPGCLASLSQKELDTSTRAVCAKLGVELVELRVDDVLRRGRHPRGQAGLLPAPQRAHPRPGRGARHPDDPHDLQRLHAQPAPGQQEAAAGRRRARARQRNLAEVGAATYSGGVDVRHLLWEVSEGDGYERFKEIAVRSLEGLKVAPFYGCQILRPSKLLGFEADPDRPQSLERLIEACGAEAIDYEAKIKCCGFPIVLAREDVALGMADPAAGAGRGRRRRRDRDAVPALPPLARRLAAEGREAGRARAQRPDPAPGAAARRRRRASARTS